MPVLRFIALLACLALCPAGSHAQEFRLEEIGAISTLSVMDLKSKTIAFADLPSNPQDGVFIRYEDWAKSKPLQQQFLGLYPGYTEPNLDVIVDGVKKHYREKLHMYVAEARFIVAQPATSINFARFATLPFAQQLDPAIKHRPMTPADLARPREPKTVHNQNPQRRWCESRPTTICFLPLLPSRL